MIVLRKYEANVLDIMDLANSNDASVILLYPEFWKDSPFLKVLKKISRNEEIPLIDTSLLIDEEKKRIEYELQEELNLEPIDDHTISLKDGLTEVVFRVYSGDFNVPESIFIVGNHSNLGNSISLPSYTYVSYLYTNSGRKGEWEGLDVPDIRTVKIDNNRNNENLFYLPIETFGEIYMKADPWHTNALGYELIASAIFNELLENERVINYLNKYN